MYEVSAKSQLWFEFTVHSNLKLHEAWSSLQIRVDLWKTIQTVFQSFNVFWFDEKSYSVIIW